MGKNVSLPQLGESVDSGTVIAWLVEVGDRVEVDQAIAEVSTDKVDTEIPSSAAGTVTALLVDVDDVVAVGQPILALDGGATDDTEPAGGTGKTGTTEAVAAAAEEAHYAAEDTGVPAAVVSPPAPGEREAASARQPASGRKAASGRESVSAGQFAATGAPLSPLVKRLLREASLTAGDVQGSGPGGRITPEDVSQAAGRARPRLSPLVKRLLREHELVPGTIQGTGADGRITPDDVRAAISAGPVTGEPPATEPATPAARATAPTPVRRDGDRVEPLSRMRGIIATRMLESLQTTAQLTSAVEADVTRIMQVRSRVSDAHRSRYGTGLSPMAFIARAVCRTLARHPVLNASIDTAAGEAVYHRDVNLGIAVDAPQGLVVPAIARADQLTVVGLQQRIAELAARARDRKLTPDDVTGGTFTITNTGSRGSLFDTPILNPPEVGILATPAIEKRPVVITDDAGNDTIAIRSRTYLCLTYDHRLVDGADAARFLSDLAADLDSDAWEREVGELLA